MELQLDSQNPPRRSLGGHPTSSRTLLGDCCEIKIAFLHAKSASVVEQVKNISLFHMSYCKQKKNVIWFHTKFYSQHTKRFSASDLPLIALLNSDQTMAVVGSGLPETQRCIESSPCRLLDGNFGPLCCRLFGVGGTFWLPCSL